MLIVDNEYNSIKVDVFQVQISKSKYFYEK